MSGALVPVDGRQRLERLLRDALDAEWAAQSARQRPLAPSRFVREALELAMALTPHGIFGVARRLHEPAETPEALVRGLLGSLPVGGDAWTERMLERMRPLAAPAPPQLPPGPGLALVVRAPVELDPDEESEPEEPEPRAGRLSRFLSIFRRLGEED